MTTTPTTVPVPTREQAIEAAARDAAEMWRELTPEQQARIIATRKAEQARRAS